MITLFKNIKNKITASMLISTSVALKKKKTYQERYDQIRMERDAKKGQK